MKMIAIGKKEMLIGLMLGGLKEILETEDTKRVLEYLYKMEEIEESCLTILDSEIYDKIKEQIEEIEKRNPLFIIYRFSGGRLN